MQLFGYTVCAPAAIYFVIAAIMMVISFIFAVRSVGGAYAIWNFLSQLISALACTVILAFVCTAISPIISWIFTGLIILLTLGGIVMAGTAAITMAATRP